MAPGISFQKHMLNILSACELKIDWDPEMKRLDVRLISPGGSTILHEDVYLDHEHEATFS